MRRGPWGLILVVALAGCAPAVPHGRVMFANLAGTYYAAGRDARVDGAMVEDAEALLRRAVAELNRTKGLDFVVLSGDLFARADALSLDRLRAILADLRLPYYVVLGDHDGPSGSGAGVSRSTLVWAFQGHGFQGARSYWSREVLPGLVLLGLDTATPGQSAGHVDEEQLRWLDRNLAANWDKAVLVAGHHGLVPFHPLDEGSAWRELMVDNAEAVREVLAKHPNVLMVLSGHHHFAAGRVSGRIVYLASPSVSVWPLAYHLVLLTTNEAEATWVPLAWDDLARRAQERLLGSRAYRGVFPAGEDGDTACVRLFGGNKMVVYPLPAIRP